MKERKIWVDWLKVLGMYFIVWGHMFPPYMSDFLYAFSVPLFFMTSGYLQPDATIGGGKSQYYKKIVNRLLVPYFATCVVYLLYDIAFTYYKGMFDPLRVVRSIGAMIIGVQSFDDGCGCVSMWFVYALFIIKLIDAFIPNRFKPVFAILCIACAIPLSKY